MTAAPAMADVLSASAHLTAPPSDGPPALGVDGAAGPAAGINPSVGTSGPTAGTATGSGISGPGAPPSFTDALDAAATQQSTPTATPPASTQDPASIPNASVSSSPPNAQDAADATDGSDGSVATPRAKLTTLNGALSTSRTRRARGSRATAGSHGSGGRAASPAVVTATDAVRQRTQPPPLPPRPLPPQPPAPRPPSPETARLLSTGPGTEEVLPRRRQTTSKQWRRQCDPTKAPYPPPQPLHKPSTAQLPQTQRCRTTPAAPALLG